jgi:membrane protein implicated in regulation of membrane protease activity
MSIDAGQLIAISLMGVALAFGISLFYLLVLLAKWTWRWVAGTRPQSQQPQTRTPQQELGSEAAYAAPVSASDLYVIRSNLDAVARQIEDLERKLKLSETYGSNIVSLKRK